MVLPALPSSIAEARRAVGDYASSCGVDPRDVKLAVSEAVTNAILHGYPDDPDGEITIDARPNGALLAVTVSDAGSGIDPQPLGKGLGLGLPLIGRVTRSVEISSGGDGRGTQLIMRFGDQSSKSAA
jgi:serine/threonine-protein kinase RsbW/stage II sporulation protein AB (anti-sigma F factor)